MRRGRDDVERVAEEHAEAEGNARAETATHEKARAEQQRRVGCNTEDEGREDVPTMMHCRRLKYTDCMKKRERVPVCVRSFFCVRSHMCCQGTTVGNV